MITRLKELHQKHERWAAIAFFLLGFLYDAWSLDPIDSAYGIVKQAIYLSLCALLLALEILAFAGKFQPPKKLERVWHYQLHAIHFLLGTLLNQYTLFFFKSASLWSSFVFIVLLGLILFVNEVKQLKGSSGIGIRAALFSISLVSYFVYVVPVIQGFVGTLPFLLSLVCAALVGFILFTMLRRKLPGEEQFLRKQLLLPLGVVISIFLALYFTRLIPPIPLSISYSGIFHEVRKENGKYLLGTTRPWWKFWQKGDQTFMARPGDKVYAYVRIFSPSRFRDRIQVRWLYDDPRVGWQNADAIPIDITGGREEGYRGFTYKSNYQPGDWQVRVETTDGREVGRIYFSVVADSSTEDRPVRYESQ